MRRQMILSFLTLIMAAPLLASCEDVAESLGMSRKQVDEGSVKTNPPLSLPPDYALKPPRETPKDQEHDPVPSTDPDIHHL